MAGFKGPLLGAAWLSLFAAATAVVITERSNTNSERQGAFSVPVAHSGRQPRHGPTEYMRTLAKYNIEIPHGLRKVVSKFAQATGKDVGVPAHSQDGDLMWLAPASVGTPPQQLYLDFDTGSSDTWVFSTDTAKGMVKGQTLYDPTKSTTSSLIENCTWAILYGDWSSSNGICYSDTFTLASLEIPHMTIESAQTVSAAFGDEKDLSGLVGLAFGSIIQTNPKQRSLTDKLLESLNEPLFTSDLRHNSSEGSFNFGFVDHDLHGSKVEYIDVDSSDGFWGVQFTGFSVVGEDLTYELIQPENVILDTGTTLLFAPDIVVQRYYQSVPGSNYSNEQYGYVIPCNSTPPDFMWQLGDDNGKRISGIVPGAYLIYDKLPDGTCYSGLQSLGSFTGMGGIMGDVMLKAGFQVWDVANKRFGSAPKPESFLKASKRAPPYPKTKRTVLLGS